MDENNIVNIVYDENIESILTKWKVKKTSKISENTILCECKTTTTTVKVRSQVNGQIVELLATQGHTLNKGDLLAKVLLCQHLTLWRNMCAECGADLKDAKVRAATIAMEHSIPDLLVTEHCAKELGQQEVDNLIKNRKLVLLLDLDQTLIHTTNNNVSNQLKDVYHFQLRNGKRNVWYHTKFRPHLQKFLSDISKLYELHICTFGIREYAHNIANLIDPERKIFQHRILSRDECFHPSLKTLNLKSLFPCGDSMVCIVDDREDVWKHAPNLVPVKPYVYFVETGDINSPELRTDIKNNSPSKKHNRKENIRNIEDRPVTEEVQSRPQKSKNSKEKEAPAQTKLLKLENINLNKLNSVEGSLGIFEIEKNQNLNEKDLNCDGNEISSIDARGETEMEIDVPLINGSVETNIENNEKQLNKDEVLESSIKDSNKDSLICKLSTMSKDNILTDKSDGNIKETESITDVININCIQAEENLTVNDFKADAIVVTVEQNLQNSANDASIITQEDSLLNTENKMSESNNLVNNSIKEIDFYYGILDPQDTDNYLIYLTDILTRVHAAYYHMFDQSTSHLTPMEDIDLKKIIPYVRKKILKGCNLVFSGIYPVNQDFKTTWAYTTAKSLGANIHAKLYTKSDCGTTHLIAARTGTEKYKVAQSRGTISIVSLDWLKLCSERWSRLDEKLFPVSEENNS